MFNSLMERVQSTLFNSEDRLKADFPWTFGKMAKTYGVACVIFMAAQFLPLVVFLLGLLFVVHSNPGLASALLDPNSPYSLFDSITLFGKVSYQFKPVVMNALLISCFLSGFAAEIWYIRRAFHKDGLSLRKAMCINLDSLGGSFWAAAWRAAIGFAVVIGLNALVDISGFPKAQDPTAEFALTLGGASFVALALLGAFAAPICEEFVFRGFLFNVCRTSFRKWTNGKLQSTVFATVAVVTGIVLWAAAPVLAMSWFARVLIAAMIGGTTAFLSTRLPSTQVADWAAILLSAATFAAFHMNLSGFLPLMIGGIVLAYLYRRSGTLIAPMMLHFMINASGFAMIWMQHVHH